jgi:hypothetical protein
MLRRVSLLTLVILMTAVTGAEAQRRQPPRSRRPAGERGFIGASVGGLVTSSSFDTTVDFDLYREPTSFDTSYDLPAGLAFDVSGGVKVWRQLGVAVAVSRHEQSGDAAIAAQLPHPFFFDRLRPLDGAAANLSRSETAVHVGALWMKLLSKKLLLTLSGGPSVVWYKQDVVTSIGFTETYPFDSAQFSRANVAQRDGTAIGGFGSGEVYYKLTQQLAVGGGARFSRAADDVETAPDQFVSIKTGGLQVGGGVRFLF